MVYISGLPSRVELNAIFLSLHSAGISGLLLAFENVPQAIENKIAMHRYTGIEALFNLADIRLIQLQVIGLRKCQQCIFEYFQGWSHQPRPDLTHTRVFMRDPGIDPWGNAQLNNLA